MHLVGFVVSPYQYVPLEQQKVFSLEDGVRLVKRFKFSYYP